MEQRQSALQKLQQEGFELRGEPDREKHRRHLAKLNELDFTEGSGPRKLQIDGNPNIAGD